MLNQPQYVECPRCRMRCVAHTDKVREEAVRLGNTPPCAYTPEECQEAARGR